MGLKGDSDKQDADVGTVVTNGKWLSGLLQNMRMSKAIRAVTLPKTFQAKLRGYQQTGLDWLS